MKHIELTQGQTTLVDDIDYDYLMQWKWFAHWDSGTQSHYARHRIALNFIHMHRIIMERELGRKLERHEQVDHLFGNTLDNRRSKLAIKTNQGNMVNRGKQRNNTSGYKGVRSVHFEKQMQGQIRVNQKTVYLCSQSNTEEGKIECAKMYDRAYLYFFGDMATDRGMNFPELKEQYLNDLKNNKYKWMKFSA